MILCLVFLAGSFFLGGTYMLFVTDLNDQQAAFRNVEGRLQMLGRHGLPGDSLYSQLFVSDVLNDLTRLSASCCLPENQSIVVGQWIDEVAPYAEKVGLVDMHSQLAGVYQEHLDDEPEWVARVFLLSVDT
ncbi:MAG: hypothetical protein DHS20C11_24490 [Lysobacteraceae bacterium]|nr:MAG: hypothetical protein DHS20C11_24490 [Xanthomonadaceae bacterium]